MNAAVPLGGVAQVVVVGEALNVEGTPGNDRIRITPTGRSDTVRVFANGRPLGAFGPVKSLDLQGGAGDDMILVGLGVRLPAKIDGGAGDDRLRGGGGPDLVDGGGGDDRLVGSPNRDALDAGSGSNRVTVPRSMGVIEVGPSVRGNEAIKSLGHSYTLRRWSPAAGVPTGPIVVGAADLQDARIVGLLQQSYGEGRTVALADATAADADRLRQLLGYEGQAEWPAEAPQAALVAFRETDLGARTHHSMDVILPQSLSPRLGAAGRRASGERMSEVLSRLFSATPVVPGTPPGDGPTNNLLNLADSYQSTAVATGQYGDQVQIVNSVWAARSFQNSEDLYYVLQEVDYHALIRSGSTFPMLMSWRNDATSSVEVPGGSPTLLQPSPQTSQSATTESSTVGYNVGGNVGIQSSGVTALLTGGVSVSNTKTVVIPPVTINNDSDLSTGATFWSYTVNDLGKSAATTLTFYNQWIWALPFTAYGANQKTISIDSGAALTAVYWTDIVYFAGVIVIDILHSKVPLPFGDTFKITAPTVTGVSPPTVKPGDEFVVSGVAMYPALVTGVLIGGTPLASSNYQVVDGNQIKIVAPNTPGVNLPVVVQTTKGTSNDDVTITITA